MFKILYVLASSESDIYYEQAFVSITSLRMHNPKAFVSLLIDDKTAQTLNGNRANIKSLVNEVIVKEFDAESSNMFRSRALKTTMRNLVDGDFLYIDCDTIIIDILDKITQCPSDLAAVLDQHTVFSKSIYNRLHTEWLKSLSRDIGLLQYEKYFNGGVIFSRDTDANRLFFKRWHKNWKLSCTKGIKTDQTSLALTNYQLGFPLQELDGKWNCQIWAGANYLHSAKVWHYFAKSIGYASFNKKLPSDLKKQGVLTDKDLAMIAEPKGLFEYPTWIVTGDDCKMYHSSLVSILRFLYRRKKIFRLLESFFRIPKKWHDHYKQIKKGINHKKEASC